MNETFYYDILKKHREKYGDKYAVRKYAKMNEKREKLTAFIRENWIKSVRNGKSEHGLVLPYPITVPCMEERYTCFFYWDTYFTNLGLIYDRAEQVRNNLENMKYFVETMGYIPNGNMEVMFHRSQPPLYAHAVMDYYHFTKDASVLRSHYESIKTEYGFWMKNRMTPMGLNQYGANPTEEEIFDFYDELAGRDNFKDVKREREYLLHYYVEAESGWDFTSRFDGKAMFFAQVDLNSILYKTERILAEIAKILATGEADYYSDAAEKRKTLMDRYMRDENGVYHDYNFVTAKRSALISGASMTPFGMGVSEDRAAAKRTLEKLEFAFGVAVSEETSGAHGFQWAFPNMWAPVTYWIYAGAKNAGLDEDAARVKEKYMSTLENVFEKTGQLWEKYDVRTGDVSHSEYVSPPMMGWTAGVYRYFREN